ncbi:response regulator transcription factor [Paenibacillus sp. CMAA1364]
MYKLLIVEDEPTIRAGLKHYFPWTELGVHTIFEAENGKIGMDVALAHRPDLVITDIRMPEMNGLEMIEQLRSKLPNTVFIILTGYSDFSYAQKAIQVGGIQSYLLKPLEYEESLSSLMECLKILENRKQEQLSRLELENEVKEGTLLIHSQVVKHLLEGDVALEPELIQRLCGFKGTHFMFYSIVVANIPNPNHLQVSSKGWKQIAETLVSDLAVSVLGQDCTWRTLSYFYKSKLYAITLFEVHNTELFHQPIEEYMLSAAAHINLQEPTGLFIAVGSPSSQLSSAGLSLQHTERALYKRFSQPGDHLFCEQTIASTYHASTGRSNHLVLLDSQLILENLEQGNHEKTRTLMNYLADESRNKLPNVSIDEWLAFLQEIINVTLRFAHKNKITVEGVYSNKLLTLTFIDDFQTLDQLFDWLFEWIIHLHSVYRIQNQTAVPKDTLVFEQIRNFIEQHIDQDLTLQIVADRFFYNPSYLSRLFKTKLNKNYITFVTEIRIQHAQKKLQNPELLITDICMMCGYKSYKHFVKMFRTITHMTPTEYRKQLGAD